jgi:hypothetical protein
LILAILNYYQKSLKTARKKSLHNLYSLVIGSIGAELLMIKKQNTEFLLKWFVPLLFFDGLMLALLFALNLITFLAEIKFFFLCIFILTIYGILLFIFIRKKQGRLLQSETPEPIISSYFYPIGPRFLTRFYSIVIPIIIPIWKPAKAYQNALFYTYYGKFEAAQEELDKIEWEKFPPMVQSDKKYIEALFAFLAKKEYKQGLELAREALRLHEYSWFIPGRKILYSRYTTLIEIGEVLNGNENSEIICSLEKKFNRHPLLNKLLIGWALENAYHRLGDIQKAEQMRLFIEHIAPHCVVFAEDTSPI